MHFDENNIIGDILEEAPDTAEIFLSVGMTCLGCPVSRSETLREACAVHGVDVTILLERLNACVVQ